MMVSTEPKEGTEMTLNTDLYIRGELDHFEVHRKIEEFLGIPETAVRRDEVENGIRKINNAPMQGFSAWVMGRSNVDGSEVPAQHNEWCDEENCGYSGHDLPAHHIHIDIDTAYGYRDEFGRSCTVLHADVIVRLAVWLQERGASLMWSNEYTGTLHEGIDRDALTEFLGQGDNASAWFQDQVLPMIKAMGGASE